MIATVRSTLDDTAKATVQSKLQPMLVDLLDLAWSDEVAERMTSVGISPDGRVQRVAGASPADPAPESWTHQTEVVAVMADRVEAAARATRQRLEGLDEVDPASEDLLIGLLDGLEMQLWMLSAQQA